MSIGPTAATAPRVSVWSLPRWRSMLLLVPLAGVAALGVLAARVYTDLLWFQELGQEDVFWTTFKWKLLARGVTGLGTAAILIANFAILERAIAKRGPPAPGKLWAGRFPAYLAAACLSGLIASESFGRSWRPLLLWTKRSDFGVTDPLFHRDVGFFVFSLPVYRLVAAWLLFTLLATVASTVAAYAAAGAVRFKRPRAVLPVARVHLLALGALLVLWLAFRYWLDQFELALPHGGGAVPGATYTDVRVRLVGLRTLVLLTLAGAAMLVYGAWRRTLAVPAIAVAAILLTSFGSQTFLPPLVERFAVQPQRLSRERPYVAYAIAATRRAFDLDRISTNHLSPSASLTAAEVEANRETLDNVPLWDTAMLRPAFNELQSIGQYYHFPSATTDRYRIGGKTQLVSLSARQLDLGGIRPQARNWANKTFAYTHGFGVAAVPLAQVDRQGHPQFAQREFSADTNPLALRQPRLYYGHGTASDPAYVVAKSTRAEVDEPVAGGESLTDYHYRGTGGISLGGPLRRLAFAARFKDLDLLLTKTVTPRSRIMLHRDAGDRVRSLVPFLRWDGHAQTAVVAGRIQFLFHGYTTSSSYPYSQPVRVRDTRVNYIRAGALATVDAYSGRVRVYQHGGDPILRAWSAAYPGLFLPDSKMPSTLRAHLRYPGELFSAQARAYEIFHIDDPTDFWTKADAWERPVELSGELSELGDLSFPDDFEDGRRIRPSHLLATLPGDKSERFMRVTMFSPRGRQNLSAYLSGWIDSGGQPQLTLLSLPRDKFAIGPAQATRRILASPPVSDRLDLLNRETRDLGKSAINRTVLGAPRVVPVADGLVHIQPVYVTSEGSGLPRLRLVTVYANGRVGYGSSLRAALDRVVRPQGANE